MCYSTSRVFRLQPRACRLGATFTGPLRDKTAANAGRHGGLRVRPHEGFGHALVFLGPILAGGGLKRKRLRTHFREHQVDDPPADERQWDGAGEDGERVTKKDRAESMTHVAPVAFARSEERRVGE